MVPEPYDRDSNTTYKNPDSDEPGDNNNFFL